MDEGRSLLDHSALILELERLLKQLVDVASERALRWPLRKEVLKDAIPLMRDDRSRLQGVISMRLGTVGYAAVSGEM